MKIVVCAGLIGGLIVPFTGCGRDKPAVDVTQSSLENRAYIVARDSDEMTVIDLARLEIIGQVKTGGTENHMGDLNADFTKLYIDSSETDQTVVVDVKELQVTSRITVGKHPTHMSLTPNGLFAIMNEYDSSISFVDTTRDIEVKRLPGFYTPHFMRMAPDGKHGFVANIGASHITRVDLATLEIDKQIPLEGTAVPTEVMFESGFADAQINRDGILYAAHNSTGRVLIYDTNTDTKVAETA